VVFILVVFLSRFLLVFLTICTVLFLFQCIMLCYCYGSVSDHFGPALNKFGFGFRKSRISHRPSSIEAKRLSYSLHY